eukprot:3148359-Karenia_brevis.AAC.1
MPLVRVHAILDHMSSAEYVKRKRDKKDKHLDEDESEDDALLDRRALAQSNTVNDAMQMTARLWARTNKTWLPDVL